MRSPRDLLDLPFTFALQRPLTPHEFRDEARSRDLPALSLDELQGYHRLGLLVPMLRVGRDGRKIAALARSEAVDAWEVAQGAPTSRTSLLEASGRGALFDPADEGFYGRSRLRRRAFDVTYQASEYLYSPYQLMAVSLLKRVRPMLRIEHPDGRAARLEPIPAVRFMFDSRARWLRALVVPLSALEPIYRPEVTRSIRLFPWDYERYAAWRRGLRLGSTLRWLRETPNRLREAGSGVLDYAERIDPLGDWHQVVREADPKTWESLRGDARLALEMRIAAELFLRYYDDLVSGGRAPALSKTSSRWERDPFERRLKSSRRLESVLTEFGLSPHPRLILVVEGATEMLMFRRLMAHFRIRTDSNYIALEDREGVDKDLSPLLAYAVSPRTDPDGNGRYLRLQRPPTRILVTADAERSMRTEEDRRKMRQIWRDRLLRTMPPEQRTDAVKASLDTLIYVDVWDRRGQSFEFAHFTDLQLARAIAEIDERVATRSLAAQREVIAKLRATRSNIKKAISDSDSKVVLADALWPVLLAKVERAQERRTALNIPIVRVLERAIRLAREVPRSRVVLPVASEEGWM